MEKEKEWCQHFEWQKIQGWWCFEGSYIKTSHWKQCPICFAPRPAKKKTLADQLHDVYLQSNCFNVSGSEDGCKRMAQAALSHFEQIVKNEPVYFDADINKPNGAYVIRLDELLRKLAQDGEK